MKLLFFVMTDIIFDNGSSVIKAGIGGEDFPALNIRLVEESNDNGIFFDKKQKLVHGRPIEKGIIKNWDIMENVWEFSINEMNGNSDEFKVLMIENYGNPDGHRHKSAEIMFEKFGASSFMLENQSVLSLLANGKESGLVINCGDELTQIVPVYNITTVTRGIRNFDFAGKDITSNLEKLLNNGNTERYPIPYTLNRDICEDIKIQLGVSSFDYFEDSGNSNLYGILDKEYTLPDGQVITIGSARLDCTEILFRPYLFDIKVPGIHKVIGESLNSVSCISHVINPNIVVSGAALKFPHFCERLEKELSVLNHSKWNAHIYYLPGEMKYLPFIGASIVTCLNSMNCKWVSKEDYYEIGALILDRKCFV